MMGYSTTRGSKRIVWKFATKLQVLNGDNGPGGVSSQFDCFKNFVGLVCEEKESSLGTYFESHHGIWVPTIVSYYDEGMRDAVVSGAQNGNAHELQFLMEYNGYPSAVANHILEVASTTLKPISVVVGHPHFGAEFGHAVTITIQKEVDGRLQGMMKDTLPLARTGMNTLTCKLFKLCGVKTVNVVAELVSEKEVFHTDCLKEAYKAVADRLDGRTYSEKELSGCSKSFNL